VILTIPYPVVSSHRLLGNSIRDVAGHYHFATYVSGLAQRASVPGKCAPGFYLTYLIPTATENGRSRILEQC
jgi:hypothetical protein